MKKWKVPVTWEVCGVVECVASSMEEAMEYAKDDEGMLPLPDDSDYVDGSWRLSFDISDAETVRKLWNDNQKDE